MSNPRVWTTHYGKRPVRCVETDHGSRKHHVSPLDICFFVVYLCRARDPHRKLPNGIKKSNVDDAFHVNPMSVSPHMSTSHRPLSAMEIIDSNARNGSPCEDVNLEPNTALASVGSEILCVAHFPCSL